MTGDGISQPDTWRVVLGSQSPRRYKLLSLLIPGERIVVHPPRCDAEAGFDGLSSRTEFLARLQSIAQEKNRDVRSQLPAEDEYLVLTADTVIVAESRDGVTTVLGKPDGPDWERTVTAWFHEYLFDRTHEVITAVCITGPNGRQQQFDVTSAVRFDAEEPGLLEWYLGTRESLGKAGGYGIQSAGGLFADRIDGSLSNVVGLPLRETWHALRKWGAI